MKKVVIAEKPSVAKNIADAYSIKARKDGFYEGDDLIITWVFGHLLQLFDAVDYDPKMGKWQLENFPFIPKSYNYKVKSENGNRNKEDAGAKRQINIIKTLVERSDVDAVISATDWDREGQVIADEIIMYIETEKPVYRLLLNEWTKEEVLKGINSVISNEDMKPMRDAGFGRQIADWLIGINLTSVATVKYKNTGDNKLLNIGRVLLPTLKIIYDRDQEIINFESSKYYKMQVNIKKDDNVIEGLYYEEESEKFEDKDALEKIKVEVEGNTLKVIEKEVEQKKEKAPLLFNLSNLQGFITSKYKGFTSDKVLKVAQQLYEKKLITYPRTASNVLDESLVDKVKKVLESVKVGLPYENDIKFTVNKRIFDSKKVESHSAITPTYVLPKNLSGDEKIVYEAVRNRFVAQFMPVAISEETKLTFKVVDSDISGVIIARGKVQIQEGFRLAENITSKDTEIPMVNKDEILDVIEAKVVEVVRKPPKYHTEKTLLKVMETCGKSFEDEESDEMMMAILSGFSIGTPATRAETIKKLKDVGYIEQKKKTLTTTDLGKMMVETFPVTELFDLEYTGKLEKTLSDIERKKFDQKDFLDTIIDFTKNSVEKIKEDKTFASKVKVDDESVIVGICPECGNPVLENEKAFGCSNWRNGCNYTIWKNDSYIESFGKKVSKEMVKLLLQNGKVGFHGLKSKKGNKFSAYFRYEKDIEKDTYSWKMEFISK
ncbi:MAG: DNA topoisomerase [Anaerovoracaceae bacterium]